MSGWARNVGAKLGWLTEPFAGTCTTCCEKVRALAPHAVWVSDNLLRKKLDFSSKAPLGKNVSMFWARGAQQSLRQHVCDVLSGGVVACGLRPWLKN